MVVALGGAPVELVVATDVCVQFLQLTAVPEYLFRVCEKMVLRIKEPEAIMQLECGKGADSCGVMTASMAKDRCPEASSPVRRPLLSPRYQTNGSKYQ